MPSSPNTIDSESCLNCAARRHCLPSQMSAATLPHFEQIVSGHRALPKQRKFLVQGNPFRNIYIIRSGQCKTEHESPDGGRQVVGLHGPGQMVGLEGLGTSKYRCDATALCDSVVCEVPYADLATLMARHAPLLAQFHVLLGIQLERQQRAMIMLGNSTAPQRIASFLLDLGQQHAALGESDCLFNLRMSREEIGSYLGLAVESISRVLTRFRAEGLVNVSNRKIVLRDTAGLRKLAEMAA